MHRSLISTQSGVRRLIAAQLSPCAPCWSRWRDYWDGNPIRPIPWIPRNPLSCHPTPPATPHTLTMSPLIPVTGMHTSPVVHLWQKHGILSNMRITENNWTWILTSQRRSQKEEKRWMQPLGVASLRGWCQNTPFIVVSRPGWGSVAQTGVKTRKQAFHRDPD